MNPVDALLAPRSVVLVGASPNPGIIRGRLVEAMRGCAFPGPVYCISRSHDEIGGFPTFASIDELPEAVDLAIIAIPAELVAGALEACGRKGIRAAVIVSSGFSEERGEAGAKRQAEVVEVADRHGMTIIGPNGEGFLNSAIPLAASFSPAVVGLDIPLLPPAARSGGIAVVSHSGGVGFSFFNRGRPKALRFSQVISMGNEAGITSLELVDYLLDDPATDVITMFVEGLKQPERLAPVASRAAQARKPIVVAKMGSSEAGARAAASHTASLAGSYEAYRAMFDRYGITCTEHVDELVDVAGAFAYFRDCLPAGRRVAVLTPSGGAGIWLADACSAAGLSVPELDEPTQAAIDEHLPAYGATRNPVDLTAQAVASVGYARCIEIMLDSPVVDAVMVACSVVNPERLESDGPNLLALRDRLEKPVIFCGYTSPHPKVYEVLSACGFPCFTSMPNAARAMVALADYRVFLDRFEAETVQGDVIAAAGETQTDWAASLAGCGVLPEFEAKALLARQGVIESAGELLRNAEEARALGSRSSGAFALKVQSAQISHKTEAGGVALNVGGAEEMAAAFERITASATAYAPEASIDGVLAEPMAGAGVEMILGIVRDADFGPMLMVGSGGVLVELLEDVALSPVPVSAAEAGRLLDSLTGVKLLRGVRGAPPADREALVALMVRLSEFAAAAGDALSELDLNPVIVHPEGQGLTVADALIVAADGVD